MSMRIESQPAFLRVLPLLVYLSFCRAGHGRRFRSASLCQNPVSGNHVIGCCSVAVLIVCDPPSFVYMHISVFQPTSKTRLPWLVR